MSVSDERIGQLGEDGEILVSDVSPASSSSGVAAGRSVDDDSDGVLSDDKDSGPEQRMSSEEIGTKRKAEVKLKT